MKQKLMQILFHKIVGKSVGLGLGGQGTRKFYCTLPDIEPQSRYVLVRNNVKFVIKRMFTLYLSTLLFIRSFFLVERPRFLYVIIIGSSLSTLVPFVPLGFNIFFLAFIGFYLIGIDSLCSFVSQRILENVPGIWDDILSFLSVKSSASITNYFKEAGLSAIIIGRTAMTPTGRAAIFGAVIGGSFMLGNTVLHGKQQAAEGQRNRDSQAQENQRGRDFQAQQAQAARAAKYAEAERVRAHERARWAEEERVRKASSWWPKK